MAKELPYFRFTAFEWLNDDISLESYELKGLFIDVCSYYWFKDCNLNLDMLNKRFSNATSLLEQLFSLSIIKLDNNNNININFLNIQYDLLSEKRKKRQSAGRTGGLKKSSNARAMLKQKPSYKDKDKDKDKDNNKDKDKRKETFKNEIFATIKEKREKYSSFKNDITEFLNYWSEHGIKDKKMRYEKEKSFGIERRLDTWFKNKEKFNPKKQVQKDQSDFSTPDLGWKK